MPSLLLIAAIMVALSAPRLTPLVRLYLELELISTVVLELINWLVGWRHFIYTATWNALMMLLCVAFAGVIWEAQKPSPSR